MNEKEKSPQNSMLTSKRQASTDSTPILTQQFQLALPFPRPPKSKAQKWSKEKEAAELDLDMPRRERDVATIAAFPGLSDDKLSAFILNNRWKFARTMPSNPHFYCVRDQSRDQAEFTRFVMHIRKFGYENWFWNKPYIQYDLKAAGDEFAWSYWTMGWSLETTIIINRKPLSYDKK